MVNVCVFSVFLIYNIVDFLIFCKSIDKGMCGLIFLV